MDTTTRASLQRLRVDLFCLRAAAGATLDALDDLLRLPEPSRAEQLAILRRVTELRAALRDLGPPTPESREDAPGAPISRPVDPEPTPARPPTPTTTAAATTGGP